MGIGRLNILGYDTKYWWFLLAEGIFFVCLGIWILLSPEQTYFFLSVLLAGGMLVSGTFEVFFSFFNSHRIGNWGWIFFGGLVDAILGAYFLCYPLLTMILVPLVVGLWMIFSAFMTVSSPIKLKILGIADWIWLIVMSMLLILPSLFILIDPFVKLVNMVAVSGSAFIISGIFRIYFSQQLRRLKSVHSAVHKRKKYLYYGTDLH